MVLVWFDVLCVLVWCWGVVCGGVCFGGVVLDFGVCVLVGALGFWGSGVSPVGMLE